MTKKQTLTDLQFKQLQNKYGKLEDKEKNGKKYREFKPATLTNLRKIADANGLENANKATPDELVEFFK
jgi:hypothetical protein